MNAKGRGSAVPLPVQQMSALRWCYGSGQGWRGPLTTQTKGVSAGVSPGCSWAPSVPRTCSTCGGFQVVIALTLCQVSNCQMSDTLDEPACADVHMGVWH
jgi:hypothetical protein